MFLSSSWCGLRRDVFAFSRYKLCKVSVALYSSPCPHSTSGICPHHITNSLSGQRNIHKAACWIYCTPTGWGRACVSTITCHLWFKTGRKKVVTPPYFHYGDGFYSVRDSHVLLLPRPRRAYNLSGHLRRWYPHREHIGENTLQRAGPTSATLHY